MEIKLTNTHIVAFFLTFFLLAICVISFATKGIMIQAVPSLTLMELVMPEVYRSAEGLICMDAIFAFYCILFMFLICRSHSGIITIFQVLLALILVGRFVLGVTFLAGNDNALKDVVTYYDDLSDEQLANLDVDVRNQLVTTRGAWIFEIIAISLVSIIGPILIFLQNKIKPSTEMHQNPLPMQANH